MLHPWEGLAFLWDQSLCSALCSQKENPLNSQLSMGLTAVGHPQAIQRKTTEETISNLALQAWGLKITLPLSAIDDFP